MVAPSSGNKVLNGYSSPIASIAGSNTLDHRSSVLYLAARAAAALGHWSHVGRVFAAPLGDVHPSCLVSSCCLGLRAGTAAKDRWQRLFKVNNEMRDLRFEAILSERRYCDILIGATKQIRLLIEVKSTFF